MYDLARTGALGDRVTPVAVARFYLARPARMWRHAKVMLPIAFSLRPEWCGNFEQSAGRPAGAKSGSFSLWSAFHERVLARAAKAILVMLLIAPLILIAMWIRFPGRRRGLEFAFLWVFSSLIALGAPVYGEAWDNVKHMFLFNLLIDAGLIWVMNLCVGMVFLQSNK